MSRVSLFVCPQLERVISEHVRSGAYDDVNVIALEGSPEGSGCSLPRDMPSPGHAKVAICGPCASGDPAVSRILLPALDVSCCEEIVADGKEITQALAAGAHLFLPTRPNTSRDIPWRAWGFRSRDDAVVYLRACVRSLCFVADKDGIEERPPKGLEDLPLRRIDYQREKLRLAVDAAIDHARLTRDLSDWRGRAAEYQMLLDFLLPLFNEDSIEAGVQRVESLLSDTLGARIRIRLYSPGDEPTHEDDRAAVEEGVASHRVIPLKAGIVQVGEMIVDDIQLAEYGQRYEATLVSFAPLIGIALHKLQEKRQEVRRLGVYRAVLESTHEGVVITDPDARILSVNAAFCAITGYSEEEVAGKPVSLLKSGVQDEAFYANMWRELIETGHWLGEVVNQRKDGSRYVERLSISAIYGDDGKLAQYAGLLLDVTEQRKMSEQLEYRAHHDSLTGLLNRESMHEVIATTIRDRRNTQAFALIYIDIDRFKWINDSYGHETGDALLIEVGKRIRQRLRTDDYVGRIGGDEFLVLARRVKDTAIALELTAILHGAFSAPAQFDELQIDLHVSMGVALYPFHGTTPTALLAAADEAMYLAKKKGRNRFHVLSADESESRADEVLTRSEILEAINRDSFQVYFQPIVALPHGRPVGAEALIRLFTAAGKAIPPEVFMATAERHGLADVIGSMVVEKALAVAAQWPSDDSGKRPYLSLNVTASQLNQGSFSPAELQRLCDQYEVSPGRLVLEVIERTVIDPGTTARRTLTELRELGARIALDDFGTGYSAFAYLTEIEVDFVKIDRKFIAPLPGHARTRSITEGLIAMCQGLQISLIAEGVETPEQARLLDSLGVEFAQGFIFARPMPAQKLAEFFGSASAAATPSSESAN